MGEQSPSPVQGECLTVALRGDCSLKDTAPVTLWSRMAREAVSRRPLRTAVDGHLQAF